MPAPLDLTPKPHDVPLLFTGHGASLAVARAAAATLMQLGRTAVAALPSAPCPPIKRVHVSRSASLPDGQLPDLLVTEAGSRPTPWTPRVDTSVAGDPRDWVPLAWVEAAALALRTHIGLADWQPRTPAIPPMSRHGVVLMSDSASDALQTLLISVAAKVPELRLEAAASSELGHGLHGRLVANGGTLIRVGGAMPSAVTNWLDAYAPSVRVVELQGPADPLAALAASARFLGALATSAGIDLVSPRLPPIADRLRHLPLRAAIAEVA